MRIVSRVVGLICVAVSLRWLQLPSTAILSSCQSARLVHTNVLVTIQRTALIFAFALWSMTVSSPLNG